MFIFSCAVVGWCSAIHVCFLPWIIFRALLATNSGIGSPMRIWSYWAAQSGPGSPPKGLLCFWHTLYCLMPVRSRGTLACLGGWRVTQYRLQRPHGNRTRRLFQVFCFNAVLFSLWVHLQLCMYLRYKEHDSHMHMAILSHSIFIYIIEWWADFHVLFSWTFLFIL